tara:strand:- start:4588 stop:4941 length:354 start_codon:yes stop_codon:yes gene_type:complete
MTNDVTDQTLKEYDKTVERLEIMEASDPAVIEYLKLCENKSELAKGIRTQAAESGIQVRTNRFMFTVYKKKKIDWKGMFSYFVEKGIVKEAEIDKWTEEKNESRCVPIKDESTDIEL